MYMRHIDISTCQSSEAAEAIRKAQPIKNAINKQVHPSSHHINTSSSASGSGVASGSAMGFIGGMSQADKSYYAPPAAAAAAAGAVLGALGGGGGGNLSYTHGSSQLFSQNYNFDDDDNNQSTMFDYLA